MPNNLHALRGLKVAILASNGFNEADMTRSQKALQDVGAHVRIISSEHGLACGWTGTGWGHHFAIDSNIREALAADYDALIIPGGQRSIDKLRLTAHTKRFVSSFMAAHKPVAVFGDALQILPSCCELAGRTVTGPESVKDVVVQAGAVWAENDLHIDDLLLTGCTDQEGAHDKMVAAALSLLAGHAESRAGTVVETAVAA